MTERPLVSVVILNRNRVDSLRRCLESVLALDWPNLEILVVDNASTDGSGEMVSSEFAERARLIARGVNSVTGGRNEGFREAKGEFVFSLDNDMSLPDPGVVEKAVGLLSHNENLGALAFKLSAPGETRHQNSYWWHPVSREEGEDRFFYTHYFSEAAVFFRTAALRATGGYTEEFFMGSEQVDLAFSLLREGYDILYCPTLVAVDRESREPLTGRDTPIHRLNLRNKLWVAWMHYPFLRAIPYVVARIGAAAARSIRYGYIRRFLRGALEGLFAPSSIRSKRLPLPPEAWQKYDRIRQGWFFEDEGGGEGGP